MNSSIKMLFKIEDDLKELQLQGKDVTDEIKFIQSLYSTVLIDFSGNHIPEID